MIGESKVREDAHGWQSILTWLHGRDILFLKHNMPKGDKHIVVLPWEVFIDLLVGRHEWGTVLRKKHANPDEEAE